MTVQVPPGYPPNWQWNPQTQQWMWVDTSVMLRQQALQRERENRSLSRMWRPANKVVAVLWWFTKLGIVLTVWAFEYSMLLLWIAVMIPIMLLGGVWAWVGFFGADAVIKNGEKRRKGYSDSMFAGFRPWVRW